MDDMRGTTAECAAKAVAYLLKGKHVERQIVLGPIVWQPIADKRRWYFVVATGNRKGARFDQLAAPTEELAVDFRSSVQIALIQRQMPIVIHDMADELQMARLCEAIWPSPKTTKIRANIEAERLP